MAPRAELSGPQRVAAFLLSLDKEVAVEVFRHLDDEVVAEVAEAMTTLGEESADEKAVDALYAEIARSLHAPARLRAPRPRELSDLLGSSIGAERAKAVLAEIEERRRQERPFEPLEAHPPDLLSTVLREESPAVAALVLAHLDPAVSAAVLSAFDGAEALDVVKRMATIKPPGGETLALICQNLLGALAELPEGAGSTDHAAPLRSIAELLAFTEQAVESSILKGLESADADAARAVREFMFTWEDLADVDKRSMQKILGAVDTKTLSLALKGCSKPVESNVLSNLSTRVREMVAEERELAGSVPMTEVLAAREEVMLAVRALMEAGEFRPKRAGDELVS